MASSDTRERIIRTAEKLFAERGFHGVSVREIAAAAELRLSHLQYHFKSKNDLYHAVVGNRILTINHARLQRLDTLGLQAARVGNGTLEDIVRAFIEPTVTLAQDHASGGHYYAQLIAQISNEPAEHARRVSRDFTDPIARVTLQALQRALPDLDEGSLPWAYIFAVGAMIASISQTGRVKLLSNGACDPKDAQRIVSLLVPFIAGGLRAISEVEKAQATASAKSKRSRSAKKPPATRARGAPAGGRRKTSTAASE